MKIFIDSADIEEIKTAKSLGIIDGITTNPSLIKKAYEKYNSKDFEAYINSIFNLAKELTVNLEIASTSYKEIIQEATALYNKFKHFNVVVKVPVSSYKKENLLDGIKAINFLSKKRIKTNATLIMTPEQALLASKAGAKYVSPFAGRIDDFIRQKLRIEFDKKDYFSKDGIIDVDDNGINSGVDLVENIYKIFKMHNLKTMIIAASIRNARQAREVALAGADIATLPFYAIKDMLKHQKTEEGSKKFEEDIIEEYKNILH